MLSSFKDLKASSNLFRCIYCSISSSYSCIYI